jgi:hypothetical protein
MAIAYKNIVHTMNRNIEMQDFDGPESRPPMKAVPVAMVVLAAWIIGAPAGIMIADGDALPFLKKTIASQLADVRSYFGVSTDIASAKPETPEVIPTGLSSVVAIYHSSKLDSDHMAFDLGRVDLVRAGKLRNPDRIYFDLQDRSRKQGTSQLRKTQKTVSIGGSLLTGIRISQRKSGTTRIVLDLKRSCEFTYQTSLGHTSRLMVEIRPRPTSVSVSAQPMRNATLQGL